MLQDDQNTPRSTAIPKNEPQNNNDGGDETPKTATKVPPQSESRLKEADDDGKGKAETEP